MKLSTAIRLGAMLKPQAFGVYFNDIGTCAIGAALDACGALDTNSCVSESACRWPIFRLRIQDLPFPVYSKDSPSLPAYVGGPASAWSLGAVIAELNDAHRWTREAIADWVETVEASFSVSSVESSGPPVGAVAGSVESAPAAPVREEILIGN